MPIIFGLRTRSHSLGIMMRACATCGRVTPTAIFVIKRFFTLFFIPVIPFPHTYRSRCSVCGKQAKIPHKAGPEIKAAFASGQAQQTASAVQAAITPPSNPPAGWYPDPQVPGSRRWWDGKMWGPTQAQVPPPSAAPPALPSQPSSSSSSGLPPFGLGGNGDQPGGSTGN